MCWGSGLRDPAGRSQGRRVRSRQPAVRRGLRTAASAELPPAVPHPPCPLSAAPAALRPSACPPARSPPTARPPPWPRASQDGRPMGEARGAHLANGRTTRPGGREVPGRGGAGRGGPRPPPPCPELGSGALRPPLVVTVVMAAPSSLAREVAGLKAGVSERPWTARGVGPAAQLLLHPTVFLSLPSAPGSP